MTGVVFALSANEAPSNPSPFQARTVLAVRGFLRFIHRSPRLKAVSVGVTVAISAERDQIFVCVVTQQAPRENVVDLETIGTVAILTSPAVTLQHFDAEFAKRI